jgi:hypothetical protein
MGVEYQINQLNKIYSIQSNFASLCRTFALDGVKMAEKAIGTAEHENFTKGPSLKDVMQFLPIFKDILDHKKKKIWWPFFRIQNSGEIQDGRQSSR